MINPEDAAESARLLLQDRLVTKEMRGIFPATFEPSPGQIVLDLACGSGCWVLDVARAYPNTDVIGVDISQKMIRYAQAQAGILRLLNASFQVMDILEPLQFPENAFQFVNARFLSSFMPNGAMQQPDFHGMLFILSVWGTKPLSDCERVFSQFP